MMILKYMIVDLPAALLTSVFRKLITSGIWTRSISKNVLENVHLQKCCTSGRFSTGVVVFAAGATSLYLLFKKMKQVIRLTSNYSRSACNARNRLLRRNRVQVNLNQELPQEASECVLDFNAPRPNFMQDDPNYIINATRILQSRVENGLPINSSINTNDLYGNLHHDVPNTSNLVSNSGDSVENNERYKATKMFLDCSDRIFRTPNKISKRRKRPSLESPLKCNFCPKGDMEYCETCLVRKTRSGKIYGYKQKIKF